MVSSGQKDLLVGSLPDARQLEESMPSGRAPVAICGGAAGSHLLQG